MARRKRNNDDWVFDVAKLIALLVGLSFLHPQLRAAMIGLGQLLLLLGLLALAGFIIWRILRKKSPPAPAETSAVLEFRAPTMPSSFTPPAPSAQKNLADQLRNLDWFQFEKVVEVLYRQLGYSVSRRGGANPDGGIDLIIEKDGQRSAVQCKQWKTWNVGVKPVREFLGALTDAGIQKGIFITLSGYTGDAKQLAQKHGIEIVNENDLVRMLEQSNARFNPELISALSDSRKMCPKCESEMVLRRASKGIGAGRQFWGCSTYPRCRFTMQM